MKWNPIMRIETLNWSQLKLQLWQGRGGGGVVGEDNHVIKLYIIPVLGW